MLLTAFIAIALSLAIRFVALHYARNARVGNVSGFISLIVFAIGLWCGLGLLQSHVIAAAPVAANSSPQADSHQPAATTRTTKPLSQKAIAELTLASGKPALGSLDALTTTTANVPSTIPADFQRGTTLYVRGWVADAASKSPAPGCIILLDFKRIIDGTPHYGVNRPDVAQAYSSDQMALTGFSAIPINTAKMSLGEHVMQVAAIDMDGAHFNLVPGANIKFTLR